MEKSIKNLPKQRGEFSQVFDQEIEKLRNCLLYHLSLYVKYKTATNPDKKAMRYEWLMDEEEGIPDLIREINELQASIESYLNEIAEHYDELADFFGIEDFQDLATDKYKPEPCRKVDMFKRLLEHFLDQVKSVNESLNFYILDNIDLKNDFDELMDLNPKQRNITDEQEEEFQRRYEHLYREEDYLKSLFICNLYNFTVSQMEEEPSEHDRELVRNYSEKTLVLASELADDLEFVEKFIEEHREDLCGYNLDNIQFNLSQWKKTIKSVGDLTECYVLDEL